MNKDAAQLEKELLVEPSCTPFAAGYITCLLAMPTAVQSAICDNTTDKPVTTWVWQIVRQPQSHSNNEGLTFMLQNPGMVLDVKLGIRKV